MNAKELMDRNMYNAAFHLMEAGKYMSDVDDQFALRIMLVADKLLSIIDAPKQKIDDESMDDILNEILNSEN